MENPPKFLWLRGGLGLAGLGSVRLKPWLWLGSARLGWIRSVSSDPDLTAAIGPCRFELKNLILSV